MLPSSQIVAHHLRLMGLTAHALPGPGQIVSVKRSGGSQGPEDGDDNVLVAMLPQIELLSRLGVSVFEGEGPLTSLKATAGKGQPWARLRSFHPTYYFEGLGLSPVVTDESGRFVWAFQPGAQGGVLLVGSDLAADLTLLRQGRPEAATNRPTEAQWGYEGERPGYLFEEQLDPTLPFDRPADWWIWTLRDALVRHAAVAADSVLPGGAPGAIIVTGDDDQAPIEDYRAQAALLGDLPVTYFLHPLTKHNAASLAEIGAGRDVEWELHPDALDAPAEYDAKFSQQAKWFERLLGRPARLVRNHGFLNDGYWGHAKTWLAHGVKASGNLPGVDGRAINGSLLPARLVLDEVLTEHWSVLTAFGDGAMFVYDWDAETALEAILAAGRRIIDSGVPGVLVINLHPANTIRAAPMHEAARELVAQGFAAMTLGGAIEWFSARDMSGRFNATTVVRSETVEAKMDVATMGALRLVARSALDAARTLIGFGGRR